MYYYNYSTIVPICQLFEAIEKLQYMEELDDLSDKLRKRLHKLFVKLPVKELPDGSFGRKYADVTYFPNGMVTYSSSRIFLKGYPEPDYPKTIEKTEEESVCTKGRRIGQRRSICYYTNAGGIIQKQMLSYEDRKITNLLGDPAMPIYEVVEKFGKLASLEEMARNVFWSNSKTIENKVERAIDRATDAILYHRYLSFNRNKKQAIFYLPEAFEIVKKEYLKINKRDADFNWRERKHIENVIENIEKDPSLIITTDITIEDFQCEKKYSIDSSYTYSRSDFQTFMTRGYPKLLKLAEEHELLRIYFEKAEILPPPSAEIIKERKIKAKKAAAKKEAEMATAEAAGSTVLEAEVLGIA